MQNELACVKNESLDVRKRDAKCPRCGSDHLNWEWSREAIPTCPDGFMVEYVPSPIEHLVIDCNTCGYIATAIHNRVTGSTLFTRL